MLLSKRAVYDSKKIIFIKKQEAGEIVCSLRIKAPLGKAPVVGAL